MQHRSTESSPGASIVAETGTGGGADAVPQGRSVFGRVPYRRGLDEGGEE